MSTESTKTASDYFNTFACQHDQIYSVLFGISGPSTLEEINENRISSILILVTDQLEKLYDEVEGLFNLAKDHEELVNQQSNHNPSCLDVHGVLNDIHALIKQIAEDDIRSRLLEAWKKEMALKLRQSFDQEIGNVKSEVNHEQ